MILLQIVSDVANHGHKALCCETPGSNTFLPPLHIWGLFALLRSSRQFRTQSKAEVKTTKEIWCGLQPPRYLGSFFEIEMRSRRFFRVALAILQSRRYSFLWAACP